MYLLLTILISKCIYLFVYIILFICSIYVFRLFYLFTSYLMFVNLFDIKSAIKVQYLNFLYAFQL